MSIVCEKAYALIKAISLIYRRFRPGMDIFYRIQRTPRRIREYIIEKRVKREIGRFRRYCRDLPKLVSEPVFVKVGANDGITHDPCSDILLANTQWKGLLIEPVPYCFDRLKANFPDPNRFSFEQVAVGASAGKSTFYYVDRKIYDTHPNLPTWFDQLGSFDRFHIIKHGIPEPFIIECTVQICTLSSLINKNEIGHIHLLHIDTEGYDYEVLKSLDFSTQAPILIFVEHIHLPEGQKKEMVNLLYNQGYSVRDCGVDYFAINEKAYKRLKGNKWQIN